MSGQEPANLVVSLAKTLEKEVQGCLRGIKIMSQLDLMYAEAFLNKVSRHELQVNGGCATQRSTTSSPILKKLNCTKNENWESGIS